MEFQYFNIDFNHVIRLLSILCQRSPPHRVCCRGSVELEGLGKLMQCGNFTFLQGRTRYCQKWWASFWNKHILYLLIAIGPPLPPAQMYATPLFATVNQYITHFDASLLRPQVFLVWNRGGLVAKMERRLGVGETYGGRGWSSIHVPYMLGWNSALKYWCTEQTAIFLVKPSRCTVEHHTDVYMSQKSQAWWEARGKSPIPRNSDEEIWAPWPTWPSTLFPFWDDHVPSKGLEPSSQIFCWTPENTGENPPLHQHAI
jgi:hypothetical protein